MTTLGIFTVKVFHRSDSGRWYTNGGYGLYLDQMSQNFDRVTMLCKLRKSPPPKGFYEVDHPNLEIVTVPAWPTEVGAIAAQPWVFFRGLAMSRRCDVVHARMPDWTGVTGALASRLNGVPCFYQIIGDTAGLARTIPLGKAWGLGAGLRLALLFYDWCERMIARRQLVFAQGILAYHKHHRASKRHLVLSSAHHDADIGVVRPKCAGDSIRLLAVGRLQSVKNHELLIRVLPRIRDHIPQCEVRILGEGPKRAELEDLVRKLRLEKAVELPGSVAHGDALWDQYDQADIFVMPSTSEGTPKVVLEAMARGCPVVASDVGGIPSAVAHEERGLLFNSNDDDDLVANILRIIEDQRLRDRCQHEAWTFAQQHTLEQSTAYMLKQVTKTWPHLAPLKMSEDVQRA